MGGVVVGPVGLDHSLSVANSNHAYARQNSSIGTHLLSSIDITKDER